MVKVFKPMNIVVLARVVPIQLLGIWKYVVSSGGFWG
jgi:hypothetical protein